MIKIISRGDMDEKLASANKSLPSRMTEELNISGNAGTVSSPSMDWQAPSSSASLRVVSAPSVLTASIGRIKEAPICDNPEFQKLATPTQLLSKLVFAPGTKIITNKAASDDPTKASEAEHQIVLCKEQDCHSLNERIISRQISRQGRETQRWTTDPNSSHPVRLVTGCVPILKNGQILLVSSSRKPEWILPKGGWEEDETMEESAIRETFEESGVVGVLGPRLSEIFYETRKGKKRRVEMEDVLAKTTMMSSVTTASTRGKPLGGSIISISEDELSTSNTVKAPTDEAGNRIEPDNGIVANVEFATKMAVSSTPSSSSSSSTKSSSSLDRHLSSDHGETSSVVSDASSNYSHVRMTLFPLYVTDVKVSWPESGRLRLAADIDDAISLLESRTEFVAALKEVKEKSLNELLSFSTDSVQD